MKEYTVNFLFIKCQEKDVSFVQSNSHSSKFITYRCLADVNIRQILKKKYLNG